MRTQCNASYIFFEPPKTLRMHVILPGWGDMWRLHAHMMCPRGGGGGGLTTEESNAPSTYFWDLKMRQVEPGDGPQVGCTDIAARQHQPVQAGQARDGLRFLFGQHLTLRRELQG